MEKDCFVNDGDEVDLKRGIQGGARRTAAYLGERRRHDRPSGPSNTPEERAPRNIFVERGVECGPALQASVTPKIIPVVDLATGNSSTIGAQRGAFQGQPASQGHLENFVLHDQPVNYATEQLQDWESPISSSMDRRSQGHSDGVWNQTTTSIAALQGQGQGHGILRQLLHQTEDDFDSAWVNSGDVNADDVVTQHYGRGVVERHQQAVATSQSRPAFQDGWNHGGRVGRSNQRGQHNKPHQPRLQHNRVNLHDRIDVSQNPMFSDDLEYQTIDEGVHFGQESIGQPLHEDLTLDVDVSALLSDVGEVLYRDEPSDVDLSQFAGGCSESVGDNFTELYGMDDSQDFCSENDRVYTASEQDRLQLCRASLRQSTSTVSNALTARKSSMKRSADGLRRAVDAARCKQTSTTVTPNIEGPLNCASPGKQWRDGFDEQCSLTSSTSGSVHNLQRPRTEGDRTNEKGAADWEYSKPKGNKVKPDEETIQTMNAEANELMKEMELRILQTRAELSKMKSSIKRRRQQMSDDKTSTQRGSSTTREVSEPVPDKVHKGDQLPDDLKGGALNDEWSDRASIIYRDVNKWLEAGIPLLDDSQAEWQRQSSGKTGRSQNSLPQVNAITQHGSSSKGDCRGRVPREASTINAIGKTHDFVRSTSIYPDSWRPRTSSTSSEANLADDEQPTPTRITKKMSVSGTFIPPMPTVYKRAGVTVTKKPQGERNVKLPSAQPSAEPLDLRMHISTAKSDAADCIFSITKDVGDLSVQDLSVAGSRHSTAQYNLVIDDDIENEPNEGCRDGRCDFDILSQAAIGRRRSVLEREDGYIYGSQPCKHDAIPPISTRSAAQYEQHLGSRRRLHQGSNPGDASPAKRRHQEEALVDDSSSTATAPRSEEGSSDGQRTQRSFQTRMMSVAKCGKDQNGRQQEEEPDSVDRLSPAMFESPKARSDDGVLQKRRNAADADHARTTERTRQGFEAELQYRLNLLQQSRDRLRPYDATSRSSLPPEYNTKNRRLAQGGDDKLREDLNEDEQLSLITNWSDGNSFEEEGVKSMVTQVTARECRDDNRTTYRNTNLNGEGQMEDGTQSWSRMLQQDQERLDKLRTLNQSRPSANRTSCNRQGDRASPKTPPRDQPRSERSSTTGNVGVTEKEREGQLETLKDLRNTKSTGADHQTTSKEQRDFGITRSTSNQCDVESQRSGHSVNSRRSATSLLEALIRSAQRNGEVTAAVRLRDKMVQNREATEKQGNSYVQPEKNATRVCDEPQSRLPDVQTQRTASDSSQPRTWNTVDTDIHVRRNIVPVERPQQLQVSPEHLMRVSQPPVRLAQQPSNRVNEGYLYYPAHYRDNDEELVRDSMVHGRDLEDRRGYVPSTTGVFDDSRHDQDHYQRPCTPPRFTPLPAYLPRSRMETSRFENVVQPRKVASPNQRYINESHTMDVGARRQEPLYTERINPNKTGFPSARQTIQESHDAGGVRTKSRVLKKTENKAQPNSPTSEHEVPLRQLLARELAAYREEEVRRVRNHGEHEPRRSVFPNTDIDLDRDKKYERGKDRQPSPPIHRSPRRVERNTVRRREKEEDGDHGRGREKSPVFRHTQQTERKRRKGDDSSSSDSRSPRRDRHDGSGRRKESIRDARDPPKKNKGEKYAKRETRRNSNRRSEKLAPSRSGDGDPSSGGSSGDDDDSGGFRRRKEDYNRKKKPSRKPDNDEDPSSDGESVKAKYDAHQKKPYRWMKPDKFDGKSSWETFLCQFENCSRYNGWDANDKTAHLRWALTGMAAQMLWGTEGLTYSKLVTRLADRFGGRGIEEKFQHELRCRRRGKHETLRELAQDVQKLMSLAYPGEKSSLAEHLARDAFLTAIDDPELELKIREREPKDLESTVKLAQRFEVFKTTVEYSSNSRQKVNRSITDQVNTEPKPADVERKSGGLQPPNDGNIPAADLPNGNRNRSAELAGCEAVTAPTALVPI